MTAARLVLIMSKKITDSAKGEDCTIRLSVCRNRTDTTVFAHLNNLRFGKGRGIKAAQEDINGKRIDIGAYACFECHQQLDGVYGDEIYLAHLEGSIETQMKLIKKGLIKA